MLRTQLIANKAIENYRKEEVKRYRASIYWAGLRRLGIVNQQIASQAPYFDTTQDAIQASTAVKNDGHNALEPETGMDLWGAAIVGLFNYKPIPKPDAIGQFSPNIDFEMTEG